MKIRTLIIVVALGAGGLVAYQTGHLARLKDMIPHAEPVAAAPEPAPPPAVSVVPVATQKFVETVLVTGSLVPREEILVAPEVEGLRVMKLNVDEGDRVKKGDVLAVLVSETMDAQVAQNDAALARAEASISRAQSSIVEAEAKVAETAASLERARPLLEQKNIAESVFEQRDSAAKTAAAQLEAARDGLTLAKAEKAQVEAQRRELLWRQKNTDVRSPADGIVSRRGARIGAIAIGAFVAGSGEPMFRIIANGEVELDGEVTETGMAKLAPGQKAKLEVAGVGEVEGKVRLVSPEVDKSTRLGRVRIFIGDNPKLRIGGFARGLVETDQATNLAVPLSAVLYGNGGATVQVVENGTVSTRHIEPGLAAGNMVEVKKGLSEGDLVVAKAGTFLRDGDAVRPVEPDSKVSEAGK